MPYKQRKLNNKITKSTSSTFLVSSRNIKNRSCENIRIKKNNSNIIPYKLKNNPNYNENQSSIITTNDINNISKLFTLKKYPLEKNIKRPISCIQNRHLKNFNYLHRENIPPELDVINLILKNSAQKVDPNLVTKKINALNQQYNKNQLNSSTAKKFYEYNIIYGYKTNNIIKTYTPKLAQRSPSARSRLKLKSNYDLQVFSEKEIIELFNEKCKDLNVPIKDELMNRFIAFIKEKCVNRIIDLSDCNLGFNSMIILCKILYENNDICSRLILKRNNFGDQGIELLIYSIQNNSNIIELNLSSNNIGTRGGILIFNYLLNQNSIISLDLSSKEGIYRNRICAQGVKLIEKVLQQNFFLEKLNLSSNSLRNEGMKYLVNGLISNSSLQILIISNNEITEKGILYMESKLDLCKLKYLDLSYNSIGNNGLISLGNCLSGRQINEIAYLNLEECSFTFDAFKPFIKSLSKNHKLQTLIVNKNNLYSNKWSLLEDSFSGMALKNISFSSCGLGPVLKNVSHIFIRNASIKYLDLRHNKINDTQFIYFQDYPKENLTLEEIDFSSNFISDKSAYLFFKNLIFNSSMQKLNFYDNQLQNESAITILDILKNNHNILNINLNCNRIGIKMMKEIKTQIINNKLIEKTKYLPKLKEELKELEFNPMEINLLKDKIISSNKEREILYKKFSDEFKELSSKKEKELEEVKKYENNFLEIQNEIQFVEKKIIKIIEENNQENDSLNKNMKLMKDKIILIEKEINEIKSKINRYKQEHDEEIQLLKDTYQKTFDQEKEIKKSIAGLNQKLEITNKIYFKRLNYLEKIEYFKSYKGNDQKDIIRKSIIRKSKRKYSKISRKNSLLISFQNMKKKEKEDNNENTNAGNFLKRKSQSTKNIPFKK